MADRQRPNVNWNVAEEDGSVPTWDRVSIAVLMDIRRELQTLNRRLACPNFTGIPETLRQIKCNTTKPKRKAVRRG